MAQEQIEGYSVEHFTDENGLPQNSVTSIVKDKNGFIWLATQSGVVRYDGRDFFSFTNNEVYTKSSRIKGFVEGHVNNELLAINSDFQLIKLSNGLAGFPGSDLPSCLTSIYRRFFARKNNGYRFGSPSYHRTPFDGIVHIYIKDSNSYFVCDGERISYYFKDRKIYVIEHKEKPLWTYFLFEGDLYCHLQNNQFALFKNGKIEYFSIDDFPDKPISLPEIYWEAICKSAFCYADNILYQFVKLKDGKLATKVVLEGFDLTAHSIGAVYFDEENKKIFLGSSIEGLYILKKHDFDVLLSGGDKRNDVIYSHTYFKNNSILTPQGFILSIDSTPRLFNAKLPKMERYSLLRSKYGRKSIWAKFHQTLYEISDAGELLNTWQFNDEVHLLYEGINGILWIGLRQNGVCKIDLKKPTLTPEFMFSIPSCTYFQQADDNNLWLSTTKGLYRIDVKLNKYFLVPELKGQHVRSLFVKDPNFIWGIVHNEGLFLLHKNELFKFPLDKKQYLSDAHCIIEDRKNYFWISTNKGLFKVCRLDLIDYALGKKKSLNYFYYGKDSGFKTNEFNGGCQPCGLEWPDGKLSFPSLKGVVVFHPDSIESRFPKSEIFFHKILLDEKLITPSDTLHVPNDFHRLTFFITTPYFGNANNLNLDISLQNDSKKTFWTRLENDNSISFTTLPFGTYNLVIRSPKGFNTNEYNYKYLVIIVPPKFWQTWWFIVICVFAFLLIISLATKYRLRYIIKKNNELELMIADRTHDLLETVAALRQSENSLSRKSKIQQKLILAFSHDLKSPLMYLMITGQRLYENIAQVPAKMGESIMVVYSSSFSMFHFTDNFLNYAKVFFMNEKPIIENVNLHELVNGKVEIFKFIARSKNIAIINAVPNYLVLRTNLILLSIIIHNLLDNAIKYTDDGFIEIKSYVESEQLFIFIIDTGMGMNDEMKLLYNNYFSDPLAEKSSNDYTDSGLGLQIVKELINIIGGSIAIESIEGVGTTMKITLNLQDQL